jgi:hypothetical protein
MAPPYTDLVEKIQFYSGVVWIPYCLLMAYLFYEQFRLRRNPHYWIMGCLLVDCVLRCIWFLGNEFSPMVGYLTINRIAILCQFTALSLLIMMWARILKVTSNVTIEANAANGSKQTTMSSIHSTFPIDAEFGDGVGDLLSMSYSSKVAFSNSNASSKKSKTELSSLTDPLQQSAYSRQKPYMPPQSPTTQYLWSHTLKLEREWEQQSVVYFWGMVVVNVIVWLLVLLSIGMSLRKGYYELYAYNIMLISLLCFAETLIIMSVGLNTGLRITQDLAPVFLSQDKQGRRFTWPVLSRLCMCCSIFTLCCKRPTSFELHIQAKAVQKLLRISCMIAFFFLLRSIGFCISSIYTE